MEHSEGALPDPPSHSVSGRALLRFGTVHLMFLALCFGIGETMFLVLGHSEFYEIGPGQEFPTLDAAEMAISVQIGRAWLAVGVFSALVSLAVWLWKRSFSWFWIPLASVPYIGPIFCAAPATWSIANGHSPRSTPQ